METIINSEVLVSVLALAVINNRLVEWFVKPLWVTAVEKFGWDDKLFVYIALAIGAALSVACDMNAFTPVIDPVVGMILTAAMIGGGANFINDILSKPNVNVTTYDFGDIEVVSESDDGQAG